MVQKQVLATFPCRLRRRMRNMPAVAWTIRTCTTPRREHRYGPAGVCSTKPAYGVLLAR